MLPASQLGRRAAPVSGTAASGQRGQAQQCRAALQFSKFQGLGNDFILVRSTAAAAEPAAEQA